MGNHILTAVPITLAIAAACIDFEPEAVKAPKPSPFYAAVICADTYDSTTYTKRIDIKIQCNSSVDECLEEAERVCPGDLKPLTRWIEAER